MSLYYHTKTGEVRDIDSALFDKLKAVANPKVADFVRLIQSEKPDGVATLTYQVSADSALEVWTLDAAATEQAAVEAAKAEAESAKLEEFKAAESSFEASVIKQLADLNERVTAMEAKLAK